MRRVAVIKCAAVVMLGLFATGAAGEPGRATWTTYLYASPETRGVVVDEVSELQTFDLLGCDGGWCHVSLGGRSGYVQADVVVRDGESAAHPPPGILPQPAAELEAAPKGPCFVSNQTGGNGGNAPTVFCQK